MIVLFHNMKVLCRKVINKLATFFGVTIYFKTKYGIKAYNKPPFILLESMHGKKVMIQPDKVCLGFDALKDDYTHVDITLPNSPHAILIRAMREGKNIQQTDYFQEEISGKLDGRFEMVISKKLVEQHYNSASLEKEGLPIIYKINQTYYVIDGKHRLATAVIENRNSVQCLEITPQIVYDYIYTQAIYNEMSKDARFYKKNLSHINELKNYSNGKS